MRSIFWCAYFFLVAEVDHPRPLLWKYAPEDRGLRQGERSRGIRQGALTCHLRRQRQHNRRKTKPLDCQRHRGMATKAVGVLGHPARHAEVARDSTQTALALSVAVLSPSNMRCCLDGCVLRHYTNVDARDRLNSFRQSMVPQSRFKNRLRVLPMEVHS